MRQPLCSIGGQVPFSDLRLPDRACGNQIAVRVWRGGDTHEYAKTIVAAWLPIVECLPRTTDA